MPLHKIIPRFNKSELRPDEKIILRVRRHWIAFVYNMVRPVAITLFIILMIILLVWTETVTFSFSLGNMIIWLILISLLSYFIFGSMYKHYIDWQFDEDILTNFRIIDVDQNYFFGRDIGITELDNIEDVSVRKKGILRTIFNYGDLDIQTAGTSAKKSFGDEKTFMVRDVANPSAVQKAIFDAMHSAQRQMYSGREDQRHNRPDNFIISQPDIHKEPPPASYSYQTKEGLNSKPNNYNPPAYGGTESRKPETINHPDGPPPYSKEQSREDSSQANQNNNGA